MSHSRRHRTRYDAYLGSEAWRRSPARLAELRSSGYKCRLCARGGPENRLEVHHRTYENVGRERPEDLCVLCPECHEAVTEVLRRRQHAATALPSLADTARLLPGRTLVDIARIIPDA